MIMVMTQPREGKARPEKRCPYCFSRQLKVEDVDVANEHERRFGSLKFVYRCKRCNGVCVGLSNL
jgi:uncharacterized protein with PIN domain